MSMSNDDALKKILELMLSPNDDRTMRFLESSMEGLNEALIKLVEVRLCQICTGGIPDDVWYQSGSGVVRSQDEIHEAFDAGGDHQERISDLAFRAPFAHDISFWKKTALDLATGLDCALKGTPDFPARLERRR